MRAVFFGTPDWAVPALKALVDAGWDVAGVVSNPDHPAGRGMELRPPPVKRAARAAGLPVHQPATARDPGLLELLERAAPDVAVVAAYGKILPGALLGVPRLGFVNLHFSLLPAYRGAAPVQRALMNGEAVTGVSAMVLTEGLDEGPILAQLPAEVRPEDSAGSLGERLARLGAPFLVATVDSYAAGALTPQPQDDSAATYAPKITSSEARIDWRAPAGRIVNHVRGLDPEPGAWTTLRGQRLKVYRAEAAPGEVDLAPGEIVSEKLLVAGTGDVPLALVDVQPAGKRRMTGEELARGLRLAPGERFG